MDIDLSQLAPTEIYHLMTQTVIPRPIAWVLSANQGSDQGGEFNLAPFSYFNALASVPPTLMISVGKKPDGSLKDTRANLKTGAACVVHIPSVNQAPAVSESSRTLDYGASELDALDLSLVPFGQFELPRIAECKVAFACRVAEVIELGAVPQAIILLTIEHLYIAEDVTTRDSKDRLKVDAASIRPLARLGANEYAALGEVFSLARPQ